MCVCVCVSALRILLFGFWELQENNKNGLKKKKNPLTHTITYLRRRVKSIDTWNLGSIHRWEEIGVTTPLRHTDRELGRETNKHNRRVHTWSSSSRCNYSRFYYDDFSELVCVYVRYCIVNMCVASQLDHLSRLTWGFVRCSILPVGREIASCAILMTHLIETSAHSQPTNESLMRNVHTNYMEIHAYHSAPQSHYNWFKILWR